MLSGCASWFTTETAPVSTYTLVAAEAPVPVRWEGEHCCLMEVRTPLPAPGFATVRMVYQRSRYEYEAFAYAQWVDTLPGMFRASVIQTLEEIGLFSDVVAAPSPQAPDYRLETRDLAVLQRFDGDRSEVEVSVRVRVIDAVDRKLLGARDFSATADAEPTPAGGVAAAHVALGEVLTELSRYLIGRIGEAGETADSRRKAR
jgi:ABC-type uncharacterized transport system auxiliary subunit